MFRMSPKEMFRSRVFKCSAWRIELAGFRPVPAARSRFWVKAEHATAVPENGYSPE